MRQQAEILRRRFILQGQFLLVLGNSKDEEHRIQSSFDDANTAGNGFQYLVMGL
jgi:hypothetical protein